MHGGHAVRHERANFRRMLLQRSDHLRIARGLGDDHTRRGVLDRRPDLIVVRKDRAQGVALHGQTRVYSRGDLGIRNGDVILDELRELRVGRLRDCSDAIGKSGDRPGHLVVPHEHLVDARHDAGSMSGAHHALMLSAVGL